MWTGELLIFSSEQMFDDSYSLKQAHQTGSELFDIEFLP